MSDRIRFVEYSGFSGHRRFCFFPALRADSSRVTAYWGLPFNYWDICFLPIATGSAAAELSAAETKVGTTCN